MTTAVTSDGTQGGTGRRSTVAAWGLFALVVLEIVVAVVVAGVAGVSLAEAVDGFVVTNIAIGLPCAIAGVLIAWQRPSRALGWLLLAAGVGQTATAAAAPLVLLSADRAWPEPVLRTLDTVFAFSWPWSIALFLPLALLVFPDGLLPGRVWRAVAGVTAAASVLFVLNVGTEPGQVVGRLLRPWLVIDGYAALAPLWTASELLQLLVLVAAVVGLVVRYRRGDEQRRRQLLWLVLALVLTIVVLVPWGLFDAGPVLQLLAIALIPAAMTIAVLRHQLLDIRLVLSRTVLYALLTVGVVGVYLALVAVADVLLRREGGLVAPGPGTSVLATLVIAVGFNPVRVRLQRVVDRALYGDRADPVRALSRMGDRLRAGTEPDDVLVAVAEALRLPYVAVRREGEVTAAHGTEPTGPATTETLPLRYRGEDVGELVVGVRRGQRALQHADRAALELLAVPLAVAAHATRLSAAVQRAREELVGTREEERRRLRRDLHDGLGPALTGIAFSADAAGNVLTADPPRAEALLRALRAAATDAIDDVRRLVYALRPPALDELGLVGALRRHVDGLGGDAVTVTVHEDGDLPPLSAAVEAAAYRITVEAVTNAVRHAAASHVDVRITNNGALELAVTDDGAPPAPSDGSWTPGVGLTSMRERVAELGGTLDAGPVPEGGRVTARLPL
ncbi:sensor histidine kinase [Actinomycetospora callitridis]|uniref:sensor histidine kinase n=1 Tax=Actinomycetospora callitridis TaxID=913944 RepID=UPI0023672D44|nr:histidine kinase [Actinomycetospora callitridis]MDD7917430.1 histidine kinase [Actinomycetospora callitridis]